MKRRGSTLIELLLVFAIIAMLLGILLPALGSARESSSKAKCMSNLRELSRTALMYRNDNSPTGYGSFPTLPWHLGWNYNGVSVTLISEFVYGGFQTSIPGPYFGIDTDMYKYPTEWRPFNKYLAPGATGRGELAQYICPSDKGISIPMAGGEPPVVEDPYSSFQVYGNSYAINWYWYEDPMFDGVRSYGSLPTMTRHGSLMLKEKVGGPAAEWVVFLENDMNSYMYDARPPDGSEGASLLQRLDIGWHREYSMYTIGFYDGHVDYKFIDTRYTRGPGWNIRPSH